MTWLISVLQDLRHGLALLHRNARQSSLIVLVLALGIGGNAAIFTLLKAAFLDPLPFRDPEQLVTVVDDADRTPSVSEFIELQARSRMLERAAYVEHRDMQVSGNEEPVRVFAARVTASFFSLLGIDPALGRLFLPEDNQLGRTAVVVVTGAFWRSRLGADPGIVGRTLRLDGQPALVVGVLPDRFHFDYPTLRIAEPVDIYVALPLEAAIPFRAGGTGPFRVVGRLKNDVSHAQAEAELTGIGRALAGEHPGAYRNRDGTPRTLSLRVVPLREAIVGTQRSLLFLLFAGGGIVLLIACANTAQLLLARSIGRAREVAVRSALGASRQRLIRQFLLEGLVLAGVGGGIGMMATGWIASLLVAILPVRSPLLESARVDWRVVAFALLVSVISALAFAIVPAIKGTRLGSMPGLTARAAIGEGNRWRHAMIALEAALSVFLLCAAGLVAQNLWTIIATPMGFDPDHVLVMRLKQPGRQPGSLDSGAGRPLQEYLQKIAAIPGVDSAASVTGPPLRPARGGPTEIVGIGDGAGRLKSVIADNHIVSPAYFRTLRIPLLAGRGFRDDDPPGRPWIAIVNEEFARQFGLGRDIVGRQIFEPGQPATIIGVVGNVRTRGLTAAAMPEVYLPSSQFAWANVYVVIRSAAPTGQLVKQVKAALQSLNSDQAVFGIMTMDDLIADAVTQPRFHAFLIGTFALLALIMAATGMYSVISCIVSQRTGEIAIRIALGATRGIIARTILGTTAIWLVMGLTAGLGLGLITRSFVRSLSSSTVEAPPWIYATVVTFFFLITLIAASAPMFRANGIDPAAALHCE